ncbi:armadillo-type protein [Halteromyces radiatus]|uniref:armadillo-type protein n=1 Tax=Halteromyces radiatus TaxID=101107 RepID=UPI00221F1496|nr:armadillo-type protein [Halteromyces radiatus]KAI8086442.1 armadillo-type protein [Halteromyces radiatus]
MSSELVPQVLEALSSLYSNSDAITKKQATKWLETFQKKPEAWKVADLLLNSETANIETRLFAAQTLRQKITYDLRELDVTAKYSLRDSLLQLLWLSASGPKSIMVQLCLALADLAAQLTEWKTVVQDVVDRFGNDPKVACCLLEFLKVLPEELSNNRLPLSDKEFKERAANLVETNAEQVLWLISSHLQTSGGNVDIDESAFKCLSSWLRTGDVDIRFLASNPLVNMVFDALAVDDLFDVCTDVVCEILYETRDVVNLQSLIGVLYPRFTPMLELLKQAKATEDVDKMRNYCRMFIEAGEAYVSLIAQQPENFNILLDGIISCTAFDDLDIAKMTFKFWYELTNTLTTPHYQNAIPRFYNYFDQLVDIIINHLHYPEDFNDWTAAERDEFRDFRHEMGDTLKDCCRILTPQKCLFKPMAHLSKLLTTTDPSSTPSTWQQIEAPIFSLRAMGSEVPADEHEVMPQIMEFLSKLPDHPKIRYAATLVISRYSFWTREHPQFITYQLNFISSGFQNEEVAAASALALKHLCKDCSELLIDFIGELHPFYINVVKTLPFQDALEVTEAIAHVMAVIPISGLQDALQSFCLPLAQDLHSIVIKGKDAVTEKECIHAGDLLEQIGAFFAIICPEVPANHPHPCVGFVKELWPVFTICINNFGGVPTIAEPLCRCYKGCIQSYKNHFVPLLPQLMEDIVLGFETTGLGVYLWVANKIIKQYSVEGSDGVAACFGLVERLSMIVFGKLNGQKLEDIPDVVEEYFRMVVAFLESSPTPLVQSDLLSSIFQAGLAGLSLEQTTALSAVIQFYRRLLGIALSVDELVVPGNVTHRSMFGQNGVRIATLVRQFGAGYVKLLFNGMIYHYPWEMISDVAAIMKSLAQLLPDESAEWLTSLVNEFQDISISEKGEFLESYMSAVQGKQWTKVRRVLSDFVTVYRRKHTSRRST